MVKQKKKAEKKASMKLLSAMTDEEEEKELVCVSDFHGITVEDNLSPWDKLVLVSLKVAKHKWENLNKLSSSSSSKSSLSPNKTDNNSKKRRRRQQLTTPPAATSSTFTSTTLPDEMLTLIKNMEGQEILPLMEKCLTSTDVKKEEHRLLMPMNKIVSRDFLTQGERDNLLLKKANGGHMDIKVSMIIQPNHYNQQHTTQLLSLKRWDMRKDNGGTINYVLTGGWLDVVRRNNLKAGDIIQIWTFRVGANLHLLLLILKRAKPYQHEDDDEDEP